MDEWPTKREWVRDVRRRWMGNRRMRRWIWREGEREKRRMSDEKEDMQAYIQFMRARTGHTRTTTVRPGEGVCQRSNMVEKGKQSQRVSKGREMCV